MRKSILIIDDSVNLRQEMALVLKADGYEVTQAVDGRDALRKLQDRRFNLVICGRKMPYNDGITSRAETENSSDFRCTPVLMLITEEDERKKREINLAGAQALLAKPFPPVALLDAVSKLLDA